MPAVLLQISLIAALIAAVATLWASLNAGVQPLTTALRTVGSFASFFVLTGLVGRVLVFLMPDAWLGYRRPRQAPATGQMLDITLPAARPHTDQTAAGVGEADQEG